MHIDVQTLMVASSLVGLLIGVTLAGVWMVIRQEGALLWWAAASFTSAIGVTLIAVAALLPEPIGVLSGVALLTLAPALFWAGARRFENRSIHPLVLVAGAAAWLAAGAIAGGPTKASTIAGFAPWVAYLVAAAFELWRGRSENLRARGFLIGLFLLHALVFVGGIADTLFNGFVQGDTPRLWSWFGIINIEGLMFSIGTAISMVGLAQQRRENRAVQIAGLDALTGTASRGTFLNAAERLLRRCREDGAPLSMIMFDLDHFKAINDTHGHLVGDNVIRAFAGIMQGTLRPNDLVGRYGGEEFAVVLPGTTIEAAYVIADRIRHGFADSARVLGEVQIHATVSGGVAAAAVAMTVPQVIDAADRALYRAKNQGRNRIQRSEDPEPRGNVIRVA